MTHTAHPKPLLSCQALSMHFGGLAALDRLDLDIHPGEVLGLVGPNGSGKTTFFNVLTGIYRPSGGSVEFEGRPLQGMGPQAINRRGIARTFQRSRLCLELSIFDNLMIGDHHRLNHGLVFNLFQRRRFRRELAGHVERARRLLNTFSSELADNLFCAVGGFPMIDRRRIEICRALIGGPRLLLLDEPSAGMTHEETRQLMEDILDVARQAQDVTIIIIEHEMNVIRRITDRCVVLNFGRKIFEGPYDEMTRHPDVQVAYLGGKEEAA
jgi:ABC-type branched-subunit amino acid transport system ATPase component